MIRVFVWNEWGHGFSSQLWGTERACLPCPRSWVAPLASSTLPHTFKKHKMIHFISHDFYLKKKKKLLLIVKMGQLVLYLAEMHEALGMSP